MLPRHAAPFDYICRAFFGDHTQEPNSRDISLPLATPPLSPQHPSHLGTHSPRDTVLLANRGGGKTFLGALATSLDLIFKPGIEIRVLGGSREQARRMFAHLKRFFSPRHHPLLAETIDGKMTQSSIRLINGSSVEILSQSHTSVRGTRVQKLRCDEVELFRPDVWEAAQFVTRSKQCGTIFVHGTIECLSTMHLPYGIMHQLLDECNQGRRKLLTWGVMDVLEVCPPSLSCGNITINHGTTPPLPPPEARCQLWDDCQGRAKRTHPPGGHIYIADAISQKSRVADLAWKTEMLCEKPSRTNTVLPEFEPDFHIRDFDLINGEIITHPRSLDALFPCPPSQSPDHARNHPSAHTSPGNEHLTIDQSALDTSASDQAARYCDHFIARRVHVNRIMVGMDFGLRGPTVILWAAEDERGVLWVLDELVESNKIVELHGRTLLDGNLTKCATRNMPPWPPANVISVDPAGGARSAVSTLSPITILIDMGLPIRAIRQRVTVGIALIAARLHPAAGNPKLWIHPRCHQLADSLKKYHYKSDDPDNLTPEKDGSDHAVDALRYLILAADANDNFRQGNWTASR